MKAICIALVLLSLALCALGTIPGGFTPVPETQLDRKDIVEAANTGIASLSASSGEDWSVRKILSCATQVVAGMNYRIVLEAQSSKELAVFTITVYKSLQGQYSLSTTLNVQTWLSLNRWESLLLANKNT